MFEFVLGINIETLNKIELVASSSNRITLIYFNLRNFKGISKIDKENQFFRGIYFRDVWKFNFFLGI